MKIFKESKVIWRYLKKYKRKGKKQIEISKLKLPGNINYIWAPGETLTLGKKLFLA